MFNRRKTRSDATAGIFGSQLVGNHPVSLQSEAADTFSEIYGSSKVQAARWFLVALASLALAIASVILVATMLPLKEVKPWVIEVNPTSGVVNRPIEVQRVDPNLAVVKAELARWAEAVYAIDPVRSSEALRWANARTADKAVNQFAEFRSRERIFERINREPELVREAKVNAVEAAQKGTAFIYLTTTERVGASPASADKTKRFRVTINYRLVPPTQEQDLLSNPLGLFVTFFADAEERAL
jgi:type IV secretion system protein VirB8